MPLEPNRLKRLRHIKGLNQRDVASAGGLTQSQVSECEKGAAATVEVLEKLANGLDCTTDFLLGRSFVGVDADEGAFKAAVSSMAYDVFAVRLTISNDQRNRCRRVLVHHAAPLTANHWAILSEQIDLALGPTNGATTLHVIDGGRIP